MEHVSSVHRAGCRRDGVVVRRLSSVDVQHLSTRANLGFLWIKNVKCGNTNKYGHVSGCPTLSFVAATCQSDVFAANHRASSIEHRKRQGRSQILDLVQKVGKKFQSDREYCYFRIVFLVTSVLFFPIQPLSYSTALIRNYS
jgi:hypothetical protein